MKEFSVSFREKLRSVDYVILLSVIGMTALSVLTLYGDARTAAGVRRVYMQAGAALVGLVGVFLMSMLDYEELLRRFSVPLFLAAVGVLLITYRFGVGPRPDSTNRCWLDFKFIMIQPSEFIKIIFIMTFGRHIDLVKAKINRPLTVLSLAVHGGIITGLVLLTGDLGSALVFAAIMLFMLFTAGLSIWYFAAALLIVVLIFPYLWPRLHPYQRNRILAGFNPEIDPENAGYQPLRSRAAIAAGGFRGAGLHGGSYYRLVPAHETDFFFAMVAEKFGFFGTFLYMVLMGVLIVRLLLLARSARKDCGANICIGVVAIMVSQTLENIGMCLGMLPVVGITLPFLSYGGSSMLASYFTIAVVESVATHNKKYYFERERA